MKDDIIEYIINITDGDLRRSINLLQSVSQFSGDKISKQIVNDICGIIPDEEIANLFVKSTLATPCEINRLIEDFLLEGFDANQLLVQLLEYIINSKEVNDNLKAAISFKIAQSERLMIESANAHLVLTNLFCEIRKNYN